MSGENTQQCSSMSQGALVLHSGRPGVSSPRAFDPQRGGQAHPNNNNFVIVELHRDEHNCGSFGFNIKGGLESGCPVYIWRVEPGSLADRSGLKSGDEIVQANGISFGGITHAEALKVLKGQTSLTLYIKAPPGGQPPPPPRRQNPQQLQQQQQQQNHQMPQILPQQPIPLPPPLPPPSAAPPDLSRVEFYSWIDKHNNPVPPPTPNYAQNRLINLEIQPGQNLGLMIRGGAEYGLGIYVTGVDPGSVAERVGLTRGDEILSVNGKDFTTITHDKAVQILKSSKRMQIVANYIGKIPADLTDTEDLLKMVDVDVGNLCPEHAMALSEIVAEAALEEELEGELGGVETVDADRALDLDFVRGGVVGGEEGVGREGRCTTSILQMIEEKARTVLNKSEHSRFTFYRIEYMQGFLPVVAFVRILLELLNTHEKYTLVTEVRELIRPSDLAQFDELIYTKSTHFRVSSANPATSAPTQVPSSAAPSTCTNARGMFDVPAAPPPPAAQKSAPQSSGQQQQLPPQPPPSFLHHHDNMVVAQQQPDEIIMDDFIEHPQPVAGTDECCFGPQGWNGAGQPPPPQQGQGQGRGPFPSPAAPGVVTNANGQLLITHDPAALSTPLPHAQITPQQGGTLPRSTASTSTAVAAVQNSTALLTPNKLATAPTTPGGTLQQGVSNHVLPAPAANGTGGATQGTGSSVPAVRFKVRINKVKPILGIAIEGGSNTPHRLPRIIDVNPDGSAVHSNLRAGQVLLTVDGKKLDGLTHEEIARLILDCYVDMTKSQIEFLVVEAKQNYYYFSNQSI